MSWRSRAGCCCGTKRVSKFQKPDSTKLELWLVGVERDEGGGLPVGGHFGEAHFEEDITELGTDFVQGM